MFVSTMNEKDHQHEKPRANTTMSTHSARMILFRGPLIMTAVMIPFLGAYMISLSRTTLLGTTLLLFGVGLSCHDLWLVTRNEIRVFLMKSLDTIVLDDVMRFIFDPQTGIMAGLVAVMVGNASMYTLGMSESQRIRMVQSCLLTTIEESRQILTAPGGVRLLLPQSVQEWFEPGMKRVEESSTQDEDLSKKIQVVTVKTTTITEEEESTTGSDEMNSDFDSKKLEEFTSTQTRAIPVVQETKSPVTDAIPTTNISLTPSDPPDPLVVMGSIVKELSADGIRNVIQHIPDVVLQGASAVSALALCLHLKASPRARHMLLGVVEGTATVSLAGATLSALTVLVVKRSYFKNDSTSTAATSSSLQLILQRWKQWMPSHLTLRQVQAALAFLVMYYFGRVRRQRVNCTQW